MKRELLIGCGSRRNKVVTKKDEPAVWDNLTTLDINSAHSPDIVWDLTRLPLPFDADTFDEIHAYEVLEHTGAQGDYKFFFAQFSEFWRILKPDGILCGTVPGPESAWIWGDPSHTRFLHPHNFGFLNQTEYYQVGKTSISDFRYLYKADFEVVHLTINEGKSLIFVLQAIKPSRIKE